MFSVIAFASRVVLTILSPSLLFDRECIWYIRFVWSSYARNPAASKARVKEIKDEIQGNASAGILALAEAHRASATGSPLLDELSRHSRSHFTYHFTAYSIKKRRVNVGTSSNGKRSIIISVQGIASIRVSQEEEAKVPLFRGVFSFCILAPAFIIKFAAN